MNCPSPAKTIVAATSQQTCLAAIRYAPNSGTKTDAMLVELTRRLAEKSIRLAGSVQHNAAVSGRRCCDMALEDLGTGARIAISQYRGQLARGCRLDSAALEEAVGLAGQAIEDGAQLLIVNKFGKRECSGGGFRSVIDDAVSKGIPVLAAINDASAKGWADYAQDYYEELPQDLSTVEHWCLNAIRQPQS